MNGADAYQMTIDEKTGEVTVRNGLTQDHDVVTPDEEKVFFFFCFYN